MSSGTLVSVATHNLLNTVRVGRLILMKQAMAVEAASWIERGWLLRDSYNVWPVWITQWQITGIRRPRVLVVDPKLLRIIWHSEASRLIFITSIAVLILKHRVLVLNEFGPVEQSIGALLSSPRRNIILRYSFMADSIRWNDRILIVVIVGPDLVVYVVLQVIICNNTLEFKLRHIAGVSWDGARRLTDTHADSRTLKHAVLFLLSELECKRWRGFILRRHQVDIEPRFLILIKHLILLLLLLIIYVFAVRRHFLAS